MENLCQRVSVTNSVHLTAKIMLLFVPYTSVYRRPNLTSFYDDIRYGGTKFCRQNLFRTKSKKAAVAILTRGLTTVKCGHHSRHSYRIRLVDKIRQSSEFRSQIIIEVVYAIYVSVYAMTNVTPG